MSGDSLITTAQARMASLGLWQYKPLPPTPLRVSQLLSCVFLTAPYWAYLNHYLPRQPRAVSASTSSEIYERVIYS